MKRVRRSCRSAGVIHRVGAVILELKEIHVERDYIGLFVVLLGIWGVEPVSGLDRADQESS